MTRAHLMTAFLGLGLACCGMQAARADQLRIALVISNEEYASLPTLERCGASATAARVALRGKGFKVIERGNLRRSSGGRASCVTCRLVKDVGFTIRTLPISSTFRPIRHGR
jgi:hypothetical protein